jgi:ribosomal protein L37E
LADLDPPKIPGIDSTSAPSTAGAPPPVTGSAARFPCRNCGAQTTWDPDADAMVCAHCGASVPVPRGEGTIVAHEFSEAGTAARGLGLDVRVARCARCGAQVTFDDRSTSRACVFCGSPQVLEQAANRNALRPESLVPLDVGRARVEKEFQAWTSRLWFRPSALRNLRSFEAVGIYVPFWTFDAKVHSDWSADAGYYYWVTEPTVVIVRGRPTVQMRQVRKIRWEPASGGRDDVYDDLLVHASKGLPEKLAAELGRFDTSALVPYRPEYLAGWHAEEYAVDLESGFAVGKQRIESTQEGRCGGDVPGDTHRNLRVRNTIRDPRWKHVLLPLWSLTYTYAGKDFPVLVHGQTGRVVGEAPYSWVKILLLVLALVGLGVLALFFIAVA